MICKKIYIKNTLSRRSEQGKHRRDAGNTTDKALHASMPVRRCGGFHEFTQISLQMCTMLFAALPTSRDRIKGSLDLTYYSFIRA